MESAAWWSTFLSRLVTANTPSIAQEALPNLSLRIAMPAGDGRRWSTPTGGWRGVANPAGRHSWQSRDASAAPYAPGSPPCGWHNESAGEAHDAEHRGAARDTARRATAFGRAVRTGKTPGWPGDADTADGASPYRSAAP